MSSWVRAIIALALLLNFAPCAATQSHATGPHITVTLLSDRDAIVPGRQLRIGLRFQMEKGWHIYWKNPGDSGEPPKVQWQLPAGFQAGAIEWPTPKRLNAPSITDYGYEGAVLLMVPVRAPANLKRGEKTTLGAEVNWLVCRQICIPGRVQLTLGLPVGSENARDMS